MTLREILAEVRSLLAAAGCDTPALDSELLAAHALGVDRVRVWMGAERDLTSKEAERLRAFAARRARREPLPYILGEWEFFGLALEVTSDVLIPRPETETLVEACLARVQSAERGVQTADFVGADVGTGSGAIAIALAHSCPDLRMLATDSSAAALAVAGRNAIRHGLDDRIDLLEGELLSPLLRLLTPLRRPLAFIAANLPYIPSSVIPTLTPEVRDYEPRAALDGGPDGLDTVRALVAQASLHLMPGGFIALEISPEQADESCRFLATNGFTDHEVINDLTGRARVVVGYTGL